MSSKLIPIRELKKGQRFLALLGGERDWRPCVKLSGRAYRTEDDGSEWPIRNPYASVRPVTEQPA